MYKLILKIFDLIDRKKLPRESYVFSKFLELVAKTENLSKEMQNVILTYIEHYSKGNNSEQIEIRNKVIEFIQKEDSEINGDFTFYTTHPSDVEKQQAKGQSWEYKINKNELKDFVKILKREYGDELKHLGEGLK